MNWKQTLILGLVSSILSSLAGIIYAKIYSEAFFIDFSSIVGTINIISASVLGCMIMSIGYKLIIHKFGIKAQAWLNILFSIVSFASIAGVLGFNLPLEIEAPEMFPGMVIPMHFFPILSILSIYPFFNQKQYENKFN